MVDVNRFNNNKFPNNGICLYYYILLKTSLYRVKLF